MSDLKMFEYIDIETCSICNRTCPTCIRNSHPDKPATDTYFHKNILSMRLIKKALNQCADIGFTGTVCLSHFNEPLLDGRLPKISRLARSYSQFKKVYFHTNGDFMSPEIAKELDGSLDQIIVSLYMNEPIKSQRAAWIRGLFTRTNIEIITESDHIPSHYSPKFNIKQLAEQHRDNTCTEAEIRVIINHAGRYLLCCEDLIGEFDLGTFPELSIKDYWFGDQHTVIAERLRNVGGRHAHPYCLSCPKT